MKLQQLTKKCRFAYNGASEDCMLFYRQKQLRAIYGGDNIGSATTHTTHTQQTKHLSTLRHAFTRTHMLSQVHVLHQEDALEADNIGIVITQYQQQYPVITRITTINKRACLGRERKWRGGSC
uniref:Uncharacterized protein n=1 Tax=Lotharella globosa TaxID=91324 RepID=A0A7S4DR00_9EUKA